MESSNTTDASNDTPHDEETMEMICAVLEQYISHDNTPTDTLSVSHVSTPDDTLTDPSGEQPNEQSSERAPSPLNQEWENYLLKLGTQQCLHVSGNFSDMQFLQRVVTSNVGSPVNSPRKNWLNYLVSPMDESPCEGTMDESLCVGTMDESLCVGTMDESLCVDWSWLFSASTPDASPRNCKQQKCYHKQRKLLPYKKRQNTRNRKQNKTNRAKDETMDCPPKKPMTPKPKLPKDERMKNIGLVVECCSRLTSDRVQSCFGLRPYLDKISAAAASVEHFLNSYHIEIVFLNDVINKDETHQSVDPVDKPRIQQLKENMKKLLKRIKRESIV